MFRGQAAPENQIHDFHPAIRPSGLYWVVDVPDGALDVSTDGRSATLRLSRVQVIDQPRWPAADARPALMDVTMRWTATGEPVEIDDPTKQFRFRGWKAKCQLAASVEVPSIQFTWESDPMETSRADFAIIGEEVNGKYYSSSR